MSPVCAPGYPDSLRVRRDPRTGRYVNFGGVQAPSPWRIFRWLLRLGPKERPAVDPARVPDLEEALKLNKPLSIAYYLKEELRTLWRFKDIGDMTSFFDDWCRRATESGIPLMASFAKTLRGFRSAILNGWVYPISNGKLEGINNKIGAMQRMHYGLRDFNFLSLRILTLHRAKHIFCG